MRYDLLTAVGCGALAMASSASATVTITQGPSAPTYANTLTFDEPGQATGEVTPDYWLADFGVSIESFDSVEIVGDFQTSLGFPWLGTGNAFFGNFGVGVTFAEAVESFSIQAWDPSGPPSPFGGGFAVEAQLNGNAVANIFVTPSWAGAGNSWFDITTTDGMKFDRVVLLGFGFGPTTYVDNLSWTVPAPGAAALFGFAGLVGLRRRR